jgi:hypothetical protein
MKNEMPLLAESAKMKAIGILGDNSLLIRAESSGETVFVSGGRWLHPLLDCIEAIETGELSGETATPEGGICIYDRVSGKAASPHCGANRRAHQSGSRFAAQRAGQRAGNGLSIRGGNFSPSRRNHTENCLRYRERLSIRREPVPS